MASLSEDGVPSFVSVKVKYAAIMTFSYPCHCTKNKVDISYLKNHLGIINHTVVLSNTVSKRNLSAAIERTGLSHLTQRSSESADSTIL